MEEKGMVNDVLESTKSSLKNCQGAIIETAKLVFNMNYLN